MGFWIWWIKQAWFFILIIIFCLSIAVTTILGFTISYWFFAYPLGIIAVAISILVVYWILENIIEPIREYFKEEKEIYKKTLK